MKVLPKICDYFDDDNTDSMDEFQEGTTTFIIQYIMKMENMEA